MFLSVAHAEVLVPDIYLQWKSDNLAVRPRSISSRNLNAVGSFDVYYGGYLTRQPGKIVAVMLLNGKEIGRAPVLFDRGEFLASIYFNPVLKIQGQLEFYFKSETSGTYDSNLGKNYTYQID